MAINHDLFWAKVSKTDGCWIWTASKNPKGYGHFGVHYATINDIVRGKTWGHI